MGTAPAATACSQKSFRENSKPRAVTLGRTCFKQSLFCQLVMKCCFVSHFRINSVVAEDVTGLAVSLFQTFVWKKSTVLISFWPDTRSGNKQL